MEILMTADERREVLAAARRAVTEAVDGRPVTEPPAAGALGRHAGAFVSLHRRGALRGCIGHIEHDRPLAHVITRCAAAAATEDPRFSPVTSVELADLDVEVSILAGIERVTDVSEIDVGRHGLIIEQHGRKGLLLPQVATEHGWDRAAFLAHTCQKAGLPPDAWRHGAVILRFEADVFGDAGAR